MLPDFTPGGLLPAGIHTADWSEFRERFAWNPRRKEILHGIRRAMSALALAGCRRLWIDGSFVTEKVEPGDWDGCWDGTGVIPELLDPVLTDFSPRGRERMFVKYVGDIFPGACRETASGLFFVDFFQVDKSTGDAKGIVEINPVDGLQ